MEEITKLEDMFEGYEKDYFRVHHDTIPYKWGGVKPSDREKVYKEALEQNKTWQEITGFELRKGIVL